MICQPDSALGLCESWMILLLSVSLIAAIVVIAVWLVQSLFCRHSSARWLHIIWIAALIRFGLFAVPQSPTSAGNFLGSDKEQHATRLEQVESELIFGAAGIEMPKSESTASPDSVLPNSQSFWQFQIPWRPLAVLWAFGFSIVIFRIIAGLGKSGILVRSSSDADSRVQNIFEKARLESKIRTKARVAISDQLGSPAMTGFFRPVILLPRWCVKELQDHHLQLVFTHELIHVQRRDSWVQLLACLLSAVHWFNPFVWFAKTRIEFLRELSCDQKLIALSCVGNESYSSENTSSDSFQREYGKTILAIASHGSSSTPRPMLFSHFISFNESLIKKRIAMLVQNRKGSVIGSVMAAVGISLIAATGFTSAQIEQEPSNEAEVQKVNDDKTVGLRQEAPKREIPGLDERVEEALILAQPRRSYDSPVHAKSTEPSKQDRNQPESIQIVVNRSLVVDFDFAIPRVVVDSPQVIQCHPVSKDRLMFQALTTGVSTVQIHGVADKTKVLRIEVLPTDPIELNTNLAKTFADVPVKAMVNPFNIRLTGGCSAIESKQIEEWVKSVTNTKVLNHVLVDPLAIKVNVYEVSRNKLRDTMGPAAAKRGVAKLESTTQLLDLAFEHGSLSFGQVESTNVNSLLERLQKQNVAKLLDQPVLVASHGRPVEFLSGGEVPVSVENSDGSKSIEFRAIGIKLVIAPQASNSPETTCMEMVAEATRLATPQEGFDQKPTFKTRRLSTGVSVSKGHSVFIASEGGLTVDETEETEIVIVATPVKLGTSQQRKPTVNQED